MIVQEATLNMIFSAVKHSEFNDFKNNRLIWNAAGYINIVSYDIKILGKTLMLSEFEWEKRYFARQAALLIYEASSDIFKLLGKEFRKVISDLSDAQMLSNLQKEITKELNDFNVAHQNRMHEIRNVSIAHRETDMVRQLNLINSISWVEAINYISAFDHILNMTGEFLQKVMDKSVREFEELHQ
jgi:hypothetical protein